MEKKIELEQLITEKDVMIKWEYFLDYGLEGDPVEQIINMFWDSEEAYGNPFDLTADEHDDLIRPVVEKVFDRLKINN
jgi:hypothetical protein